MTTQELPKGVWFNGVAFVDTKGRVFASWGVFGRKWWPHRERFPRFDAWEQGNREAFEHMLALVAECLTYGLIVRHDGQAVVLPLCHDELDC